MTRHFLCDDDLAPSELIEVLDLADQMKADRYRHRPLAGPQAVALIFDKPTLRTQLSFTAGVAELGGHPIVVDGRLAGIGVRESVADTTRVVSRQVAAIVWRTFDNMAHSYLLGGAAAGMHVRVAGPAGYHPDPSVVATAARIAGQTGGSVTVTDDPAAALDGADVVATDTLVSMGQELEQAEREAPFRPYAVTAQAMQRAATTAVVLHCLPAYRGKEIDADVIDGPHSVVWDEAENRLHAQKALVTWLLEHS